MFFFEEHKQEIYVFPKFIELFTFATQVKCEFLEFQNTNASESLKINSAYLLFQMCWVRSYFYAWRTHFSCQPDAAHERFTQTFSAGMIYTRVISHCPLFAYFWRASATKTNSRVGSSE